MRCEQCGEVADVPAAFCGMCGSPMVTTQPPRSPLLPPPPIVTSEPRSAMLRPPAPLVVSLDEPSVATAQPAFDWGVPDERPRKRRAWMLLPVAGLAMAAGVMLVLLRSGDTASGGGTSATAAVQGFADALDQEDLFAAATFVSAAEVPEIQLLLESLRTAAGAEGVTGFTAADAFDVSLEVSSLRERSLGPDAVAVTVDFDVDVTGGSGDADQLLRNVESVDQDDVGSWVADQLGDADESVDIELVVVRERERWFISPMLTVGEYLTEFNDLPRGDYDRVSASVRSPAGSPLEAIELAASAVADTDVEQLAGVLADGEARAMRVFADAIDEAIDGAGGLDQLDISGLALEDTADGWYTLTDAAIEVGSGDGGDDVDEYELRNGCISEVSGDGGEICVFENLPLRGELATDEFRVRAVDDDGYRIALVRSVIELAAEAAPLVPRSLVYSVTGLQPYDVATPLGGATTTTVSFDGEVHRVFEATLDPAKDYLFSVAGADAVDATLYTRDDGSDGAWFRAESTWTGRNTLRIVSGIDTARVVVSAPVDCDRQSVLGCAIVSGDVELTLDPLQISPVSVNTIAKPNLGAGDSIILEFTADNSTQYQVTTSPNGAELFLLDDFGGATPYVPAIVDTFPSGLNRLVLRNGLGSTQRFDVTISDAADLGFDVDRGFENGQFEITVDLSDGPVRVLLSALAGDEFTVRAIPSGSQDLVLDGGCDPECVSDVPEAGATEVVELETSAAGDYPIEVSGYTVADEYGTVTLTVEFTRYGS